ncbi:putative ribonuclease H-like domain-containing protein [Rosa chinensis]|uniref:Putative ribonuclease H-like domain-containing protein n=1 Tax=Rosa chinensis TaxID=74649 RepID=A0A2P6SFG3_ROSCH|nr:putative ribonuclease H-like domain-containing protein [Rosa chinensis]
MLCKATLKQRPVAKWHCPPTGRLKINIDGAYNADRRLGGVGVVCRDDHGSCVAVLAKPFQYASSALHMEAEALRAGLLLAIHQGWMDIEMDTDCAILVYALNRELDDDLSDIGRIMEDCKMYVEYFLLFNSDMYIGKQMVWPIG